MQKCQFLVVAFFFAANIHSTLQLPSETTDLKAMHKAGELEQTQGQPMTLDKIKLKLKESGVFDCNDPTLSEREKKELSKLFHAVEIMSQSRNRQPYGVLTAFSSLRLVERAIKKQLKEGQLSETLATRFNWDKLNQAIRLRRSQVFESKPKPKLPLPLESLKGF